MEKLLVRLPKNSLILKGTLLHIRCCAHILNLIVKDDLDVIGKSINKFMIVLFFGLQYLKGMKSLKQ